MAEVKSNPVERVLLSLGLFLLNVMFFSLILSTLLLIAGVSVGPLHFPLSVLAAAAVTLWSQRHSPRRAAAVLLAGLALLALGFFFAAWVDDWSWDGNAYHKAITGALRLGWNPLHESFYQFSEAYEFLACRHETWYDSYPKAAELFGACVYAFTGRIEAGKAFNLLSDLSVFFLGWGVLEHAGLLRHWQAFLCAALAVLTPTSIAQAFSYYNDAFLGNMFLLCLMGLLCLTFFPGGELTPLAGYCIFAAISIGFNLKFSAILFFAVLCLTFFGFWAVQECRNRGLRPAVQALRGRFFLLAAGVLSGTLLIGCTSYITNTIRYHNPLYTLIGPGSTEIITSQLPPALQPMGHFSRFIASLFSRTNGSLSLTEIEWKLPFTFDYAQLRSSTSLDVRTGGWGVFFSGILLISLAVIALSLYRCRRSHPQVFSLTLTLGVVMLLSTALIPGLCWARYFTALYYVPVCALLFLFARPASAENRKGMGRLVCGLALCGLLLANMAPCVVYDLLLVWRGDRNRAQLSQLQQLSQTYDITIGYSGVCFEGRIFNVMDAGITQFTFSNYIDPQQADGVLFNRYTLCYLLEER